MARHQPAVRHHQRLPLSDPGLAVASWRDHEFDHSSERAVRFWAVLLPPRRASFRGHRMKTVITSHNISKAYRLGMRAQHEDLRELITSALRTPMKRLRKFNENWEDGEDTFWALKDVNF